MFATSATINYVRAEITAGRTVTRTEERTIRARRPGRGNARRAAITASWNTGR